MRKTSLLACSLILIIFSIVFMGCEQPQPYTDVDYNFNNRNQDFQENIEIRYVDKIHSEASELIRQERFDEAVQKYQEGLNYVFSHPENKNFLKKALSVVCIEQALKLKKTGLLSKAIQAMRLAIEYCYDCSNDEYSTNYAVLAGMLDDTERTEESIELMKKAISYSPDKVGNYILLARYLAAIGQQQESLSTLEYALKVNPDYPMVHYELGISYHSQGKYKQAINYFKKAIELDQNYLLAYFCLSLSYSVIDMNEEAEQILDKAYSIDPKRFVELREQMIKK